MAVKKSMVGIIEFLNENLNKSVKSIIDEVTALASTKTKAGTGTAMASTFIKDAADATVAVFDYYFKRWMPLVGDAAVDFGAKASAASGFASMSKEGTSLWTKQQAAAKKATTQILVDVENGDLEVSGISAAKEAIEATRKEIVTTELGFADREGIDAYLAENCDMPDPETLAENTDSAE